MAKPIPIEGTNKDGYGYTAHWEETYEVVKDKDKTIFGHIRKKFDGWVAYPLSVDPEDPDIQSEIPLEQTFLRPKDAADLVADEGNPQFPPLPITIGDKTHGEEAQGDGTTGNS